MNPKISIIAAVAEKNRAIGKEGKLLWHISDDLKRFKALTTGHVVVVGQRTFESIGKPLPNRTNIVVSNNPDFAAPGCVVCHSFEEAIRRARELEPEEVFIIGGGQIYKQAIKYAEKLYLTLVEGDYEADTFFPDYSEFKKVVYKEDRESDGLKFTFLELEKGQ